MANGTRHLALLPKRTHELRVVGITRQVDDGSMSTNVEDGVVVVDVDLCESLGRGKLLLDSRVFEELHGVCV